MITFADWHYTWGTGKANEELKCELRVFLSTFHSKELKKLQSHGGAHGGLIIWGPWMFVQCFLPAHPLDAEVFHRISENFLWHCRKSQRTTKTGGLYLLRTISLWTKHSSSVCRSFSVWIKVVDWKKKTISIATNVSCDWHNHQSLKPKYACNGHISINCPTSLLCHSHHRV